MNMTTKQQQKGGNFAENVKQLPILETKQAKNYSYCERV